MALILFNGTVMRGEPAHANLSGCTFLEEVQTAPVYRLYSIGDRYPAMVRADEGGASIRAELYRVPEEAWPAILAAEPPGLYRGPVELDDGRVVEGMLGEQELVDGPDAIEITDHGGWRAYLGAC